jgi:hypothetical protein
MTSADLELERRMATTEERLKILAEQKVDHERRIRHLERFAWLAIGASALLQILPMVMGLFKQ